MGSSEKEMANNANKSPENGVDSEDKATSTQPESEKLNVYFSSPSNCQFYFGVEAQANNKKISPVATGIGVAAPPAAVPASTVELELTKKVCQDLTSKVTQLESTNSQLLQKLILLEKRVESLEEERKDDRKRRRRDVTASISSNISNPRASCELNESMETVSEASTITGDVIFLEETIGERCGNVSRTSTKSPALPRTTTPSPALSTPVKEVPAQGIKIVTKPNQVHGVTALEMAKSYPGRISCIFEVVNWIQTVVLNDPVTMVTSGTLEAVPQKIEIAKAFGIRENGSKVIAALSYRLGSMRIAFSVHLDDCNSTFRIGFVQSHESSSVVSDRLEKKEVWLETKRGTVADGKISTTYGNVRLTGSLSLPVGRKGLMEISITKV